MVKFGGGLYAVTGVTYVLYSWAEILYRFLDNSCVREDTYEEDNNSKGCFRLVNFEEGIW